MMPPLARPTAVMLTAGTDANPQADYLGTPIPVTVPAGMTLAVGDLVVLDRVRQTFRVSQVIGTGY